MLLAKCFYFIGFSPENALTIIACFGGVCFIAAWFYIFSAHFSFSASVFLSIAILNI